MIREDLVNSAVSFLQDPSVATAPIEKRIAFLQSKNLTQDEIDASLARAGGSPVAGPVQPAAGPPPGGNAYFSQPPQQYGYPPPGYWQPPPQPPPIPRRDWRDWFIMATVVGGVGYGVYTVAKRYVTPLIAPPTPPQLTADKAAIDAQFTEAFQLIEQLSTDTAALKSSEEQRTQRLDAALSEVESVIAELKASSKRREEDGRRLGDEVRSLRDLIPKAMDSQRETSDTRLKELGQELKSLKTLVGNRVGASSQPSLASPTSTNPSSTMPLRPVNGINMFGAQGTAATNPSDGTPSTTQAYDTAINASSNPSVDRAQSRSPYGNRFGAGRAAIPAWQMAAAKKSDDEDNAATTSAAEGSGLNATVEAVGS